MSNAFNVLIHPPHPNPFLLQSRAKGAVVFELINLIGICKNKYIHDKKKSRLSLLLNTSSPPP